jgi:uncharacterized protein YbjT (DUF2867 family)
VILVVGATGHLGGLITRTLLDQGRPVRATVRSAPQALALQEEGAEIAAGDLRDPESLRAACVGVDAVVTTANSAQRREPDTAETVDRLGNLALIDAAVAAGVERFVLTSMLGADPASPNPFAAAKGTAEAHLRGTAMDWTILQPNLFMDVWIPAVVGPALAGQPVTFIGDGRRRHSMVAARDVAAYAVAALDHDAARRQSIVLGGPEPTTWRDVVAAVEAELGRHVDVRSIGRGEEVPYLPPVMNMLLAALDTYDSPIDMTGASATYGVTPTPMTTIVRELVAPAAKPGAARG